jgi:threonine/homoserine/homoserine lactone efflux protein
MEALILGLTLGFWAGVNPGPLTLLVIRQALTQGARPAVMASLAPLLTDSVAIILAFFLARELPPGLTRALEAAGGIFVLYLGYKGLTGQSKLEGSPRTSAQSLRDAVIVNLMNPHMYLFWLTVGLSQLKRPLPEPLWFILGFYPAIIGSKALIGLTVARLRQVAWIQPLARYSNVLLLALGAYLLFLSTRP